MKELAANMTPESSTLFVLLRSATPAPDKVLEELKGLAEQFSKRLFPVRVKPGSRQRWMVNPAS